MSGLDNHPEHLNPVHQLGAADPALEIGHQHHHEHLHHSGRAIPDDKNDIVYTTGTTLDHSAIPDQNEAPLHHHQATTPLHHDEKHAHESHVVAAPDVEKGSHTHSVESGSEKPGLHYWMKNNYVKLRPVVHFFVWALFTGWWVAGFILHKKKNWIIHFLLWLAITLRIITFYVPAGYALKPLKFVWRNTASRVVQMIPEKMRLWLGAALTAAIIVVGAFASDEAQGNKRSDRAVSLFGLVVFIALLYATSNNRKHVQWHTVIVGMLIQFIVALFVLRTGAGYDIFKFISGLATDLLEFSQQGLTFLVNPGLVAKYPGFGFSVLPAIIFFIAFVQLLFYWGVLQWAIQKFAIFFFWAMRVSGSEAVVASASPFIGQGESAMLIKPFIPHMTKSELHQVMTSGFATIAGSVLVAYIGMGVNSQALLSSCVMSIPASLAASKLRYPETEESLTAGRVVMPDDDTHKAANVIHAFAEGAWLGLKIAGMIGATLLCIISLLGLLNGLLGWWGHYINIPDLTIQLIVGYICYPVAFLLGVPRDNDLRLVGELIGTKLIINEFKAYNDLQTDPKYAKLAPRSRLIVTYALCGFANIGSLGTQIGVLSQLAPSRSGDVSRMAVSALITGAISTLTSANIAGMLVTDQGAYFTGPPPDSSVTFLCDWAMQNNMTATQKFVCVEQAAPA